MKYLAHQCFRVDTRHLFKPTEAHSDDEKVLVTGTGARPSNFQHASASVKNDGSYHVIPREGRNAKVTAFIRLIDEDRKAVDARKKSTNMYVRFY